MKCCFDPVQPELFLTERIQVLLSEEDIKMMVDAVSCSNGSGVDLDSFLRIMQYSPWC
jgi:hypothetical protein